MKSIIICIALGISLNCIGQDPVLLENQWSLQDLNIDNVSNPPPSNEEITNILFAFLSEAGWYSTVCESLEGLLSFNDINSTFTFLALYQTLGGSCQEVTNFNYERLYFDFYYENQFDPFVYSISLNTDGSKTLIVTSSNGDQAIYGNQVLSDKEYKDSSFSVFYNSHSDSIDVISKKDSENVSIELFDINGKSVLLTNENLNEKRSVSLQNITNGIYFVSIKNEVNKIIFKKILKY